MTKLDGVSLWLEWDGARPLQDEQRDGLEEQLTRYRGQQLAKIRSRPIKEALDPHEFKFISKVFPRLAYDNPVYRGGTTSTDPLAEVIVPALTGAVNQICIDTNIRNESLLALLDFQFMPATFRVTMEEHRGRGRVEGAGEGGKGYGIPMRPVARRESPLRVRWDPLALNIADCSWTGWESIHDRKALIEWAKANPDEGYDWRALEELGADNGVEQVRGTRNTPSRDEIAIVNMWMRDADISEMLKGIPEDERHYFHGAICRVAIGGGKQDGKNGDARTICKPKPFFGPKCGPLIIGYAYPLWNKPGGFGPLRPTKGAADALNRAMEAEDDRAMRHRSFGLFDGTERQIAKFQNALDGSLHSLPGLDKNKYVAVEVGGPTETGQAMILMYQARLAEISAMAPSASGTVTGKGTATENIEAANTLDERTAFQAKQFHDLMGRVGRSLGWYCYHSQRVVQPLPEEVAQQVGQIPEVQIAPDGTPFIERQKPMAFYGGKRNGLAIEADEYDRFQFTLDMSSMSWQSDEAQMRLMGMVQEQIERMGPLITDPRFEGVAWADVMKLNERATGQAIFGKLFDLKACAQVRQSVALAQQAELQTQNQNPAKMSGQLGLPATPAPKPRPPAGKGGTARPTPTVSKRAAPAAAGASTKAKPQASNPRIEM